MAYNKETGMYEGYIYKITNNLSGKVYIGQTIRTIESRWWEHCNENKKGSSAIDRSIMKNGKENFTVEELLMISDECRDDLIKRLDKIEAEYIESEDSLISSGNGYNILTGGRKGKTIDNPVVCYDIFGNFLNEFVSCSVASDYYELCMASIYGICSGRITNYKNKLVFRWKGDPFDKYPVIRPNTYSDKSIDVYRKNTYEFVGTYDSLDECVNALNIPKYGITKCCNGKAKYVGKYITRFSGDSLDKYEYKLKPAIPARKINQYSLDGEYIQTFNSYKEACIAININDTSAIYKVCNKKRKTANGYLWFFSEDESQPDKSKIIA